jgi:hypothetical protein
MWLLDGDSCIATAAPKSSTALRAIQIEAVPAMSA